MTGGGGDAQNQGSRIPEPHSDGGGRDAAAGPKPLHPFFFWTQTGFGVLAFLVVWVLCIAWVGPFFGILLGWFPAFLGGWFVFFWFWALVGLASIGLLTLILVEFWPG